MATTMDKVNNVRQQVMASSKALLSNGLAWRLALATAIGAYGGFPDAPEWWKAMTQYKLFRFLLLWVLIYSGVWPRTNTVADVVFTTVVTVAVYGLMCLIDLIYNAVKDLDNIKCEYDESVAN